MFKNSIRRINIIRFFLFSTIYFLIANQSIFIIIYLLFIIFAISLYLNKSESFDNPGLNLTLIFIFLILPQALPNNLVKDFVPYGYGYMMISLMASIMTIVLNNKNYKNNTFKDLFFSISAAIFSPGTYISGPSATISDLSSEFKQKEKDVKLFSFKNIRFKLFISGFFRLSLGLYFATLDLDLINNLFNFFFKNIIQNTIYVLVIGFINFWKYYLLFSGSSELCKSLLSFFNINVIDNFDNPESSTFYHEIWNKWHLNITQRIREYIFTPLTLYALRNFSNLDRKIKYILIEGMPVIILFLILAIWHGSRPRDYIFAIISVSLTLSSREISKNNLFNSIIIKFSYLKYLLNFMSLSIFGISLLIYDLRVSENFSKSFDGLGYFYPYLLISIIAYMYFNFFRKVISSNINLFIQIIIALIIQFFVLENNQLNDNFIYFNN